MHLSSATSYGSTSRWVTRFKNAFRAFLLAILLALGILLAWLFLFSGSLESCWYWIGMLAGLPGLLVLAISLLWPRRIGFLALLGWLFFFFALGVVLHWSRIYWVIQENLIASGLQQKPPKRAQKDFLVRLVSDHDQTSRVKVRQTMTDPENADWMDLLKYRGMKETEESIGLEIEDGHPELFVLRGTLVPTTVSRVMAFPLGVGPRVRLQVVAGERLDSFDKRTLMQLEIGNTPSLMDTEWMPRITMQVDSLGNVLLTVAPN